MSETIEVPRQWLEENVALMEWAADKLYLQAGGRGGMGDRAQKMHVNASHMRSCIPGGEAAAERQDGDEPPEGYTVSHTSGGYYTVEDPEGNDVPGPANGKWQGKEAAVVGAWAHHEG